MLQFSLSLPCVDLFVEEQGHNPDSIFLHGLGGDTQSWDLLWHALGQDFPAIRYDLRGFGQSTDKSEAEYDHAEDLMGLIEALGSSAYNLVGVSMGGAVALNFALSHPERVKKLVLISPALVAWEWSEQWRALWRPLAAMARAGDMDAAREYWWRHPLFATTRTSPAGPLLHDSIMRYSGRHWYMDHHKPMLPDVDRLTSLQVPTLLLTGECDLPDFRLMADLIAASSDHVRRFDVPDHGHLLNLEVPELCARYISSFLSE